MELNRKEEIRESTSEEVTTPVEFVSVCCDLPPVKQFVDEDMEEEELILEVEESDEDDPLKINQEFNMEEKPEKKSNVPEDASVEKSVPGNQYCFICNQKFVITNDSLRRGVPLKCDSCYENLKKFSRSEGNERSCNEEKSSFICEYCNKDFCSSSRLQTHLRTHTGEKPFDCKYCDKRFTQYGHLKIHLRTHTGEKPFVCNYCNMGFTRSDSLQTHLRTHTGEKPFTCNYCNISYNQCSSLQRHMRLHTGERPFTCKYCNKGFTDSGNLLNHERTHTGEKPFICNYCNKGFNQSNSLLRHVIQKHTGEKLPT